MKNNQPIEVLIKNGNQVTIREVVMGDVESLTTYINNLSKENTFILFSGEQISLKEEKEYVANAIKEMESGNAVTLVIESRGEIIGIGSISRNIANKERSKHVGKLGISVNRSHRGQGIGKAMLAELIERAKTIAGLRLIELSVFDSNQTAKQLYEKIGFKEVGRIPGGIFFRDQYVDEIFMVLNLV